MHEIRPKTTEVGSIVTHEREGRVLWRGLSDAIAYRTHASRGLSAKAHVLL